jgi:cytochrome c
MARSGVGLGLAFTVLLAASAHAAGDVAKGRVVFLQCAACHSVEAGHNGIGPSLHGLFGRPAGTIADFRYSPAMKRSGITWNEASLKAYLPDPQAKVPGTKMLFLGIKDPQPLDDLIAYLKQASQ